MVRKIIYGIGITFALVVTVSVIVGGAADTSQTNTVTSDVVSTTAIATTSQSSETNAPISNKETPVTKSNPVIVSSSEEFYPVTKVIDGDTVEINLNGAKETLRLIGINTPETVDPRKPVECFGREASNKAKEILTGKQVRIESEASQGDRDKYGRLLTYVFLKDGTHFNKYMIEQGYAYEYTYDLPYKYQNEFKAAQTSAKNAGRGLWAPGACDASNATPPSATQPTGHTFYLSTHYSAKYYYCDSDEGWKSLSKTYLKSYPSESALLADHPDRTLHETCK